MMHRPIANGQESVCQPKPNGNLQQGADWKIKFIRGEMNPLIQANQKPIRGEEIFLITMITRMDIRKLLR